jgi:ADP-ribosylglycohydrolase
MRKQADHFHGCLIGGAIGDALGYPVEFLCYSEIQQRYGPEGIRDLQLGPKGVAEISDDTQMTLFTAEGILRAQTRSIAKGICHVPSVVYFAYQRWLITQGYPKHEECDWAYDGCLLKVPELYACRAPGNTCLSALLSRELGTIAEPINNSKGCGGLMRVAPVGLFFRQEKAFQLAAEIAALTHGHPSGYLSAGVLAYIIAGIIAGQELAEAVNSSLIELERYVGHEECAAALRQAISLADSDLPDFEAISTLGQGWVGEEALAIAVYCALRYQDDFQRALIAAVNHDGDSDSTGAITGSILGAYLGLQAIPAEWVEGIELLPIIQTIADDLLVEYDENNLDWERYPGY